VNRQISYAIVGLFMLAGIAALSVLAFKVSGFSNFQGHGYYTLTAEFDNIGGLKVRAPVRIAGVTIGRVRGIVLDKISFRAKVLLAIDSVDNNLPTDTAASILTEGILGSNFIGLTPGFEETFLSDGDAITTTHPAIILENLIGQLLFHLKDKK